jgi:hypothetical protein
MAASGKKLPNISISLFAPFVTGYQNSASATAMRKMGYDDRAESDNICQSGTTKTDWFARTIPTLATAELLTLRNLVLFYFSCSWHPTC